MLVMPFFLLKLHFVLLFPAWVDTFNLEVMWFSGNIVVVVVVDVLKL